VNKASRNSYVRYSSSTDEENLSDSFFKSFRKYITIDLRTLEEFMQFNRICIGFGHAESTNGGAFGHFVFESSQTLLRVAEHIGIIFC
jgi:hypothetical protein